MALAVQMEHVSAMQVGVEVHVICSVVMVSVNVMVMETASKLTNVAAMLAILE